MAAGDWVMAIGNPFSQGWTVTVGVISAIERAVHVTDGRTNEMLQTDAAINPGNSGGPLLNLRGEVIGMNTAIISNGRAEGNIGIGFAVPINTIRDLLPQLHTGKVIRGRIGVQMTAVPRDGFEDFGLKSRAGALVSSVAPGGAGRQGRRRSRATSSSSSTAGRSPNTSELQKMVDRDQAGHVGAGEGDARRKEQTLNATVEELDLDAEQRRHARAVTPEREQPEEQGQDSFGLTLEQPDAADRAPAAAAVGPDAARSITDVDPNGPSAGALRQGDVILSVNGQAVASAAEAGRELQRWRRAASRGSWSGAATARCS